MKNPRLMHLPTELEVQTEIRLQLLENGYRPLPTAAKVAFQKGWPTMPVNKKVIEGWPMLARNEPAVTTAIQLRHWPLPERSEGAARHLDCAWIS